MKQLQIIYAVEITEGQTQYIIPYPGTEEDHYPTFLMTSSVDFVNPVLCSHGHSGSGRKNWNESLHKHGYIAQNHALDF